MTPREVFDKLAGAAGTRRISDNAVMARCPAHEDSTASLSARWDGNRLLLHCFAGCAYPAIASALGLVSPASKGRPATNTHYVYLSAEGAPLFRVVRGADKKFYQQRHTPDGWVTGLSGVKPVLFRLPEVLQAGHGAVVLIVEGEKDVLTAETLGFTATTNPGGAGKWRREFNVALRGRHAVVIPDNDEPGRAHGQQVAESVARAALTVKIVSLPDVPLKGDLTDWVGRGGDAEQLRALIEAAPEYHDQPEMDVVRLDTVPEQPLEWVWDGLVPLRKVTLLSGDPGLGKSFLTLSLAAALSRGNALPGQDARPPVSVVLLSCEDDIADTVVPRLLAMGADLARIVAIRGNQPHERDTSRRLVTLSRDLDLVADVVAATSAARLLVIDPIAAYLGGTDANSNVEVRGILCALGEVAEQRNIAVLVVSHNRKSSQGRALHRVMGSLAFTATARSVLGVVADAAMEGRRLVVPLKSNVAINQVGYAFKVTGEGRVEWESDPVLHWDDGDFTASVEDRVEETVQRLREMLAHGPRAAIEVQRELRKSGVSHHVLWDAKRRAHVRSRRDGDRYVWELVADIDVAAAVEWAGRE